MYGKTSAFLFFHESSGRKPRSRSPNSKADMQNRFKWEKFRRRVDTLERELNKELQFHEKNPEKHPLYPEEWKKFWNKRYKELQADKKDPSKHDFKPEWISFWNIRMKELHNDVLRVKKEEILEELGLPIEGDVQTPHHPRWPPSQPYINQRNKHQSPSTRDVTTSDIRNTWRALTGGDIKDGRRSPNHWDEEYMGSGRGGRSRPGYSGSSEPVRVLTVLRLLTAMESQLGSLGPRVNDLMGVALSMEKVSPHSSDTMLMNPEHTVLFETVYEKLKGQLIAGIVDRNMMGATRSCVQHISELMERADKMPQHGQRESGTFASAPAPAPARRVPVATPPPPPIAKTVAEPVTVPGVGAVDKVAIAQQIAAALVAQGKTDVTYDQLQTLISAVVGMAQASAEAHQPLSTAEYLSQLQQGADPVKSAVVPQPKVLSSSMAHVSPPTVVASNPPALKTPPTPDSTVSALQLLQSAYDEPQARVSPPSLGKENVKSILRPKVSILKSTTPTILKPQTSILKPHTPPTAPKIAPVVEVEVDPMAELSDSDLKTLLSNFKDLSTEEQHRLILYLKKLEATEPEKVERLRQFVNLGQPTPEKPVFQAVVNKPVAQQFMGARGLEEKLLSMGGHVTTENQNQSMTENSTPQHLMSGRLSPFSLRQGGINPCQEELKKRDRSPSPLPMMNLNDSDDDDDDYSYEDIYAAASKKVREKELEEERKRKEEEDERRKIEEDKKRKEDEARRQDEEKKREDARKREEEAKKLDELAAKKREEERKKLEGERLRQMEEVRKRHEEESRRMMVDVERLRALKDDPGALLNKTNALIANIMGELPAKFGGANRVISPADQSQRRPAQSEPVNVQEAYGETRTYSGYSNSSGVGQAGAGQYQTGYTDEYSGYYPQQQTPTGYTEPGYGQAEYGQSGYQPYQTGQYPNQGGYYPGSSQGYY
uniref:Uncharacterized protein n=1 Tax=Timema tahoe TaxID=61484 RepID=A0A7R9IB19_9NEOP|nr:unnamed protein product [Timema tahoe]